VIYLLDVNVLIALSDVNHVHHEIGHRWFGQTGKRGWATCPITENAFIRILGKASYPKIPGTVDSALSLLRHFCDQPGHHFWPDDFSLRQKSVWREAEMAASTHIPDCYLLALAARHGGKFATLDRRIPVESVVRGRETLQLIG
jgi:toxin-antitoxin system PIN domain toxin